MLLTASGAIATGLSPAVRRCIDGTFGAGGGTVTEDTGTGGYKYAMAQADTNGNNISLFFTATGAMPVCINFITTAADPTDGVRLGLTGLANAVPGAAGGLFIAGTNAPVTITGTGDALTLTSTGGNGSGLKATGNGTGTGIYGNITGNVTGNLTGSVGALTGYVAPTNLTAAEIATGVWQDATAGDFTAANSVGKSIMNGVTLGTGLTVNAVTTAVALPTIPNDWIAATGIAAGALDGKGNWNVGKTGYSLSQTFPTNFSAMAIDLAGAVTFNNSSIVATISDKTGFALTTDYDPAKTAAQAGNAMALTTNERNSVADALLDRDMSSGVDSGSATVRTVRQALRFLRNKISIAGGTLTVTKENDTTASWTSAVTTDANALPIVTSDPAS